MAISEVIEAKVLSDLTATAAAGGHQVHRGDEPRTLPIRSNAAIAKLESSFDGRGSDSGTGGSVAALGYKSIPVHVRLAEEPAGGDEPVRHGGILIVDDCTLYRENLAVTLAVNGLAVSSSAWDLPSLTAALALVRPGIVLMSSATRDSANLLRVVTRISRESRVIVLGVTEDDEAKIVSFAEAGVVGYHMRSDTLDDLVTLIRRVTAGESVVPPRISAVLLRRLSALATGRQRIPRKLVLTNREVQILRMLELGLSNRDIAARLDIAVHTVKNHVHSLLSKLGVSTRAEAAAVARGYR